jgi:hypothetical protein
MSLFAKWYYDNKKAIGEADFYGRFSDIVGQGLDKDGNKVDLTGQNVIATRTHTAIDQHLFYSEQIVPNMATTDKQRWDNIVDALLMTNAPVAISIYQLRPNEGGGLGTYSHEVVAYRVDETTGELYVYDPNYPGHADMRIKYADGTFEAYTYCRFFAGLSDTLCYTFRYIFPDGEGSYPPPNESFENIYQQALNKFNTNSMPLIEIRSHQNGAAVTTGIINLSGNIKSFDAHIDRLVVYVGDGADQKHYVGDVEGDGDFSVDVRLDAGLNQLRFVTQAYYDNLYRPITPNNLDTNPFYLTYNDDPVVARVTLTWDTDDTDVDLYVCNPTGDECSYSDHPTTSDGGKLVLEDSDGRGPEIWEIRASDPVRWGEEYRAWAYYAFDAYGNKGGTNYTITVKFYEGTCHESEWNQPVSRYIPQPGSGNGGDSSRPGGPGWGSSYGVFVLDRSVYDGTKPCP